MAKRPNDVYLRQIGARWWSGSRAVDPHHSPSGWESVAEIVSVRGERSFYELLVHHARLNRYARLTRGGALRSIDQTKAEDAVAILRARTVPTELAGLPPTDPEPLIYPTEDGGERSETPAELAARDERERIELANLVKTWRGEHSVRAAADMLGVPARTLEGVEQGRGFRYAKMLALALRAFEADAQPAKRVTAAS